MGSVFQSNLKDLTKGNISGYELSTALIRNGYKLDISRAGLQVLIYLASCYNGKPVFPRLQTIAECTLLSVKGVQLAINELLQKNCILKSHKSKNNQCLYSFQKRVIELACKGEVSTTEHGNNYQTGLEVSTKPMYNKLNKTEVKKQQEKKNVVVFSSKSAKRHKSVTLDDVPSIIKENKNIQNPCAYWASLSEEIKQEYLKKETEIQSATTKVIEQKRLEEMRKEKERAELEELKKQKELPLNERYTREEAIRIVRSIKKLPFSKSGIAENLIKVFEIKESELI